MNKITTIKKEKCVETKIIIISMIFFFPLPLLFSSCLKEEAGNYSKVSKRTILFYMAGDNNLSGETQEKIEALAAAWNFPAENQLLVYQDRGGKHSPRLLEITAGPDGKGVIKEIENYVDENSASYYTFSRVLTDMTHLYPASDYGLVVFSHGSGWLPAGTFPSPRSVAMDKESELELRAFASVIPDGQFRFIVFESCLMAGAEVAYELKDKTDYILASSAEVVSPGFTPLYGKMLRSLYQRTPALREFARDYYEYCESLSGDSRSATVSVIKTSGLSMLKEVLARAESNVQHWEWVERENIQHFDRRKSDYLFYDLEEYIKTIGTQDDVKQLTGILDEAVIYKAATQNFMPDAPYGYEIKKHSGLTIYIPVAQYTYLNAERKLLRLFSEKQSYD